LERISNILDTPKSYGIRLEFLDIEMTNKKLQMKRCLKWITAVSHPTTPAPHLAPIWFCLGKQRTIMIDAKKLMKTFGRVTAVSHSSNLYGGMGNEKGGRKRPKPGP
jgi:hypothetical protein